jgi:hypothetical protein
VYTVSKGRNNLTSSTGHEDWTSTFMLKDELRARIEKLEQELTKEREYIDAIRSHKDYNT